MWPLLLDLKDPPFSQSKTLSECSCSAIPLKPQTLFNSMALLSVMGMYYLFFLLSWFKEKKHSQCNSVQSYFWDAEFLKTNALFCLSSSMVELSRTAYQEPDLSLPQMKSVVIERKRAVLIGEVVNGGPLPNPPQHNPVCSFDSNKYTGDGLASEPPPAALKGVDALWFLVH